jgi:hypothetical protein
MTTAQAGSRYATSIEALLDEITSIDYRLVSLSDMSVSGLPRWWATLHRPSLDREGIDCKFGEATCAYDALFTAFCAVPIYVSLKADKSESSLDIMAIVIAGEPPNQHGVTLINGLPKPATFKRRVIT